jgi:hypothetical protein
VVVSLRTYRLSSLLPEDILKLSGNNNFCTFAGILSDIYEKSRICHSRDIDSKLCCGATVSQ